MFRVFSRFNALFVRPKIRGAIQEYQTSLIKRVEEDILTLHKKFTAKYLPSSAARMSTIRDIPELSGTIMWARQMERQLATYVARVEDVLGKGWENYSAGKKLQQEAESFRKKLDTHPVFRSLKISYLFMYSILFLTTNRSLRSGLPTLPNATSRCQARSWMFVTCARLLVSARNLSSILTLSLLPSSKRCAT